jgi:hypothetical protein
MTWTRSLDIAYRVGMSKILAHQDAAGISGAPLGVFVNGCLIVRVDEAVDPYGSETARQTADRLGQPAEALLTCHRHPDAAAVDCLICVPLED